MKEMLRKATALRAATLQEPAEETTAATLQEAALHAAILEEAAEETTASEVRLTLIHPSFSSSFVSI